MQNVEKINNHSKASSRSTMLARCLMMMMAMFDVGSHDWNLFRIYDAMKSYNMCDAYMYYKNGMKLLLNFFAAPYLFIIFTFPLQLCSSLYTALPQELERPVNQNRHWNRGKDRLSLNFSAIKAHSKHNRALQDFCQSRWVHECASAAARTSNQLQ